MSQIIHPDQPVSWETLSLVGRTKQLPKDFDPTRLEPSADPASHLEYHIGRAVKLIENLGPKVKKLAGNIKSRHKQDGARGEEGLLPEVPASTDLSYSSHLVTRADLTVSLRLLSELGKAFPGSYSEEHPGTAEEVNQLIWQVDPIDGTAEFSTGLVSDGYVIQASLLARVSKGSFSKTGEPVYHPIASIIHVPGTGETFYTDLDWNIHYRKDGIALPFMPPDREARRNSGEIVFFIRKKDLECDPMRPYARRLKDFLEGTGDYRAYGLAELTGKRIRIFAGGASGAATVALLKGDADVVFNPNTSSKQWDESPKIPLICGIGGDVCLSTGSHHQSFSATMDGAKLERGTFASPIYTFEEIGALFPDVLKRWRRMAA